MQFLLDVFPIKNLHLVQGSATTSHAAEFGFSQSTANRWIKTTEFQCPGSNIGIASAIGWISITNNHFAILEYWCLHWLNWLKKNIYILVIVWILWLLSITLVPSHFKGEIVSGHRSRQISCWRSWSKPGGLFGGQLDVMFTYVYHIAKKCEHMVKHVVKP